MLMHYVCVCDSRLNQVHHVQQVKANLSKLQQTEELWKEAISEENKQVTPHTHTHTKKHIAKLRNDCCFILADG